MSIHIPVDKNQTSFKLHHDEPELRKPLKVRGITVVQ